MTDELAAGGSREVRSDHRAQRLVRCAVHARMMKLKEMIIFTINRGIKESVFSHGKTHFFTDREAVSDAQRAVHHTRACSTREGPRG